jgi:hypothetical protein
MNISEAFEIFKKCHLSALKHSTNMGYLLCFNNLKVYFIDRAVGSIMSDEIGQLLESITTNVSKGTLHLRYSQTTAFFNFVISECNLDIKKPFSHTMFARHFRSPKPFRRKILDKELVDELIFVIEYELFADRMKRSAYS